MEAPPPPTVRIKRKAVDGEIGSPAGKRQKSEAPELMSADADVISEDNDDDDLTERECGRKAGCLRGWDSDLTEISSSEDNNSDEGNSDDDTAGRGSEPVCFRHGKSALSVLRSLCLPSSQEIRVPSGLKIRIPSLAARKASLLASATSAGSHEGLNTWPDSMRSCGMRKCNNVLPEGYRWKACQPCWARYRKNQRAKKMPATVADARSLTFGSPTLHTSISPPEHKGKHTSVPAPPLPLRLFSHTPSYPQYQHILPLVESFALRLLSFMDAFMAWAQLGAGGGANDAIDMGNGDKATGSSSSIVVDLTAEPTSTAESSGARRKDKQKEHGQTPPIAFSFEGEYSIIAPKELIPGPKGVEETWQRVRRTVKEIERSCGLQFQ